VEDLQNNMGELSEMAQIRNHTGVFDRKQLQTQKIYGAGLLSSIGESAHCMTEK
jgi:phenylalanine-4-hydroxylase